MVIELNKNPISDHTERYRAAGLSLEFLGEMAKAVSALQAAGYEPYDQLYGYAMHGNDQYITRFGGAREIVTKMDAREQSPAFLRNSNGRLDLPGPTQEAA